MTAELQRADIVPPSAAAAHHALDELAYFAIYADLGDTVCLTNDETDAIIRRGEGPLITAIDSHIDESGIDDGGFYLIRKRPKPRKVFRARHVEQRVIGPHPVEYADRNTGRSITTNAPGIWIWADPDNPHPFGIYLRYMSVERLQDAFDFAYILRSSARSVRRWLQRIMPSVGLEPGADKPLLATTCAGKAPYGGEPISNVYHHVILKQRSATVDKLRAALFPCPT